MAFSLTQFQRHLTLAGYETRDVPFIERADLFSTKGGDRVIEHLLTFDHGGSEYALRPEFTSGAARAYGKAGQPVVRWQFNGPVFEDRTSAAQSFQRQSAGIELLGLDGPLADSEVIGLAMSGLMAQGIVDVQLVVGHAGLTRALIERYTSEPQLVQFILSQREALSDRSRGRAVVDDAFGRFLNLRTGGGNTGIADDSGLSDLLASVTLHTSTMGGRTRDDIARRLLKKQRRSDEIGAIASALDRLEAWVSLRGAPSQVLPQIYQFSEDAPAFAEMTAEFRTTLDLLEQYGVAADSIVLQPDLNRIWDYYSGVVFELRLPDGSSAGGGGRYDGLLRLLGSPDESPAVGFQIDADALWRHAGREEHLVSAVALVGSRPNAAHVLQWASELRARDVVCDIHETIPVRDGLVVLVDSDGAQIGPQRFGLAAADELATLLGGQTPS